MDASGQLANVLALPDHLRDALWRVESAALERLPSPGGLVVAGMGGSAIGGALAAAALGDRAVRPILTSRGYALPAWTTPETTVLCASYSGETEETLAAYEAAGALGARRIAVTSGGELAHLARADGVPVIPLPGTLQPRVAVAYMLVAALEAAACCGVADPVRTEIDVAAAHAEELLREWGPDGGEDSLAREVARGLQGRVTQVVGAGLTAAIAYRWKTQLNENAKVPAFAAELPEADHNEIVGWEGAPELAAFAAVFLDDPDLHPRLRKRVGLTRELVAEHAAVTFRLEARGETRVERLVSLVLLGDLVSLYLSVLRGVDPAPVEVIDRLKRELADG